MDELSQVEMQTELFPAPADAHALVRVAREGAWWLGTCSCGWRSRVCPARWRVERQHLMHRRHEAREWHELGGLGG